MVVCKNKIWFENITDLFCDFKIIPTTDMTLEQQLNSLTRLVLILFIIILLFNIKQSLIFLTISLILIIIIYYLQKKNLDTFIKESFVMEKNLSTYNSKPMPTTNSSCYKTNIMMNPNIPNNPKYKQQLPVVRPRFCNDSVKLNVNDPNYMSINQKLVGGPNPKTLIAPIIPEPLSNLEYWKTNNLVNYPAINSRTQFDAYNSGYFVSENCGQNHKYNQVINDCYGINVEKNEKTIENYSQFNSSKYQKDKKEKEKEIIIENNELIEDFELLKCKNDNNCGYLNQYDDPNIFTQTIQPGVYSLNETIEPINSNIGITYTKQINPTTESISNDKNTIFFDEHRPDFVAPKKEYINNEPNTSNIYDPRFSGYGTSYRSYTDENLGNTKFYYDDVNAIRMPNYITRNKIDIFDFAPTYGPKEDYIDTNNIRDLANQKYVDSVLEQRTSLQQSLLRKRNSELWQTRQSPMYKSGGRMVGGLGFKA
jgi:hypothetical protein